MKRSRKSGWSNVKRSAMVLVLCSTGAFGLSACGKKKEPPPPPPPPKDPGPPAPPPVSFDSISQDLKADPRVQFAPDLKLEDEELARGIVGLADALARGDASALARLTPRHAGPVIEQIQNEGGFAGKFQPEAVRVVFIGKNDETSGFKMTMDDILKNFSADAAEFERANQKIPEDVARRIAAVMVQTLNMEAKDFDFSIFFPPMTEAKATKLREAYEKIRDDPSKSAALEQIQAILAGGTAVPGLKDSTYMTLLAVQTPEGVELTGWGAEKAFGKWTFTPASTTSEEKKSASEWDGVGLAGFSRNSREGIAMSTPKTEEGTTTDGDKPSETPMDAPAPENAPEEPAKRPTEKRTPNGPVKIPGG